MSQRIIKHGDKIAMTGWDAPLQYHFLTIAQEDGTLIFSNLDRPDHPGMSIYDIDQTLQKFGIPVPYTLEDDLDNDRDTNAGNTQHIYDFAMDQLQKLWDKGADVPVDDDDCIEEPWGDFPVGTSRMDIWQWFDQATGGKLPPRF